MNLYRITATYDVGDYMINKVCVAARNPEEACEAALLMCGVDDHGDNFFSGGSAIAGETYVLDLEAADGTPIPVPEQFRDQPERIQEAAKSLIKSGERMSALLRELAIASNNEDFHISVETATHNWDLTRRNAQKALGQLPDVQPTQEQLDALRDYALWIKQVLSKTCTAERIKARLSIDWTNAGSTWPEASERWHLLQQLRNLFGPKWLAEYDFDSLMEEST